jgi:hypothetical protein
MNKFIKPTVLSFCSLLFLVSCSSKTFNEQMDEKGKKNINSKVYEKNQRFLFGVDYQSS